MKDASVDRYHRFLTRISPTETEGTVTPGICIRGHDTYLFDQRRHQRVEAISVDESVSIELTRFANRIQDIVVEHSCFFSGLMTSKTRSIYNGEVRKDLDSTC